MIQVPLFPAYHCANITDPMLMELGLLCIICFFYLRQVCPNHWLSNSAKHQFNYSTYYLIINLNCNSVTLILLVFFSYARLYSVWLLLASFSLPLLPKPWQVPPLTENLHCLTNLMMSCTKKKKNAMFVNTSSSR